MNDRFGVVNQFYTVLRSRELPDFIEAVFVVGQYLLFRMRNHWLERLYAITIEEYYAKLRRLPVS